MKKNVHNFDKIMKIITTTKTLDIFIKYTRMCLIVFNLIYIVKCSNRYILKKISTFVKQYF